MNHFKEDFNQLLVEDDALSSTLFNLALEKAVRKVWGWSKNGVRR